MSHLHTDDDISVLDDGTVVAPDLLTVLAQTHPGIVRTLGLLHGELEQADDLPADVRGPLAEHIRTLADDVERVVVIDGNGQ